MKRKIMSLMLVLVMVMTVFAGCGKEKSSYFKEAEKLCKIQTGTATAEMKFVTKGVKQAEQYAILTDNDGNQSVSLKLDSTCESTKRAAVKMSIKLGKETTYSEVTTLIICDDVIYVDASKVISIINKIDAASGSQIQSALSSMGITGYVSLNMKQMVEALGGKMPELKDDNMRALYELLQSTVKALDNNFANIQGESGDDYTITINKDNAEKLVDDMINLIDKDGEEIAKKMDTFVNGLGIGDSYKSNMAGDFKDSKADTIKSLKDSKATAKKDMGDTSLISKINTSGSEGSREGKITFSTGGKSITTEQGAVSMDINCTVKESKPSVKDMVPSNAADLTTTLLALMNQGASLQ